MKFLLFWLFVSSFALALDFDSEVPENLRRQVTTDFDFIRSVRGSDATPLHRRVFGLVHGDTYAQFFDARVSRLGVSQTSGIGVAFFNRGYPNKIWLTQNYTNSDHPQIARLMVVFHEARHAESPTSSWAHARCPTPFVDSMGKPIRSIWTGASLDGFPGCDTTAYGAYGISVMQLKNLQKFCENCTEKVRMDAGIYGDDQMNRMIDRGARGALEEDAR